MSDDRASLSGTHLFTPARENDKLFSLRINDKRGNPVNEFPTETTDTFGSVCFLD